MNLKKLGISADDFYRVVGEAITTDIVSIIKTGTMMSGDEAYAIGATLVGVMTVLDVLKEVAGEEAVKVAEKIVSEMKEGKGPLEKTPIPTQSPARA